MMTTHTVVWQGLAWPSTEVFRLTQNTSLKGEGVIAGISHDQQPFAITYSIELSLEWRMRSVSIRSLLDGSSLTLRHERGNWFDGDSNRLPEYEGVDFVDISLSPFTNTLPIRQLAFAQTSRQKIDAIYIDLPDFTTRRVQQYYSQLRPNTYRYEDIETAGFTADITVDDQGLVITYPELFSRLQ